MSRILAAFYGGLIAYMIARDCGLPIWRSSPIGDASDFGLMTALFIYFVIGAVRARLNTLSTGER